MTTGRKANDALGLATIRLAAVRLGEHPQDHGWREFYRLVGHGLDGSAPHLCRLVRHCAERRPTGGATHLVTMLGIAVRTGSPGGFARLGGTESRRVRLGVLDEVIAEHAPEVTRLLLHRQNSFTGARRFLVPQVVLSAYFGLGYTGGVRLLDVGTGLGVLPRQLNSVELYTHFGAGLRWPGGVPAFRPFPLEARFGIDRGPFPDLTWVRSCYGESSYYEDLFAELLATHADPLVSGVEAHFEELDMLDTTALSGFVVRHGVNAATLCYSLYELTPEARERVLDCLRASLAPPGLIIVIDPCAELTRPGCVVTVEDAIGRTPWRVCRVTDGHFRGEVRPLEHFEDFTRRHPIVY